MVWNAPLAALPALNGRHVFQKQHTWSQRPHYSLTHAEKKPSLPPREAQAVADDVNDGPIVATAPQNLADKNKEFTKRSVIHCLKNDEKIEIIHK